MRLAAICIITVFFTQLLNADTPSWQTDLKNLQNKPTFVMVETNYCPWCKKMKETTLSEPKVLARLQNFNSVKMLKRSWNKEGIAHIRLVPGLVFLDEDKSIIAKFNGYKATNEFLQLLDKILQRNNS